MKRIVIMPKNLSNNKYLKKIFVVGNIDWIEGPTDGVQALPSGYIPDSLKIRLGYNQFEEIDTYDYAYRTITVQPSGVVDSPSCGIVSIDTEIYKNIEDISEVTIGYNGSVLSKNSDYSIEVVYDEDDEEKPCERLLRRLEYSNSPGDADISDFNCLVLAIERIPVKQLRTFVDLEVAKDLYIEGLLRPSIGNGLVLKYRHAIRTNMVNKDVSTTIDYDTTGYFDEDDVFIVQGLKGVNLIEFEYFLEDIPVQPVIYIEDLHITNAIHFAKPYYLRRTYASVPETWEYCINDDSITYDNTTGLTLWCKYAVSANKENKISVLVRFKTNNTDITPVLRNYKLTNVFD